MLMSDKTRSDHNPVNGVYRLSRNNMELAAIVVYFFALAVLVAFTLIVMVFRTGDGTNVRGANDHQPAVMVSFADLR